MKDFSHYFKRADPADSVKTLEECITILLMKRYDLKHYGSTAEDVKASISPNAFDGYTVRVSMRGVRDTFCTKVDEIELRPAELSITAKKVLDGMLGLNAPALDSWGVTMSEIERTRSDMERGIRDKLYLDHLARDRERDLHYSPESITWRPSEYRTLPITDGDFSLYGLYKGEMAMTPTDKLREDAVKSATTFKDLLTAANEASTARVRAIKAPNQLSYSKRNMSENYDRVIRCVGEVNTMIQLADLGVVGCTMDIKVGTRTLVAGDMYSLSGIKYAPRRRELYVEATSEGGTSVIVGLDDIVDAFDGFGEFIKEEVENTGLFTDLTELQDHAYLTTEDGEAVAQAMAEDIMADLNTAIARKAAQRVAATEQKLKEKEHYGVL